VGDEVRRWLVGGAIVESERGLALVRNVRRDGRFDWTTPGGVIEPDEDVLTGLGREVTEETGLVVERWRGLSYEVRVHAVDLGWWLSVEVHHAEAFSGELCTGDDPDGIVVDAEWTTVEEATDRLDSTQPWVREPLVEWMRHRWVDPRRFGYRVVGTDLATMTVEQVPWHELG